MADYHETTCPWPDRASFVGYVRGRQEIVGKETLITRLCRDRTVLDIGCIDHSYEHAIELGDRWLHKVIRSVARDVVGLDSLEEDARALRDLGYTIVTADAEGFSLDRTFDVIVAGDLIEHLSNVGNFLSCARRHMSEDSILVLTTPNPFNVEQFAYALFHNRLNINPTHTAWLDPQTAWEILSRHDLPPCGFHWIDTAYKFRLRPERRPRNWIVNRLSEAVMARRPLCRRDFAFIVKRGLKLADSP